MSERVHPDKAAAVRKAAGPDSFRIAAAKLDAQRPVRRPRVQQLAADLYGGRIDEAEKGLTDYLARRPDDADAIHLLALASVRRGHRNEAAVLLARCVELAPGFAAARFDYAKLLLQLDRYTAALREVDRLLAEDGTNPLLRQAKANILGFMGESERELAICAQLAEENPKRAESWVSYGHALRGVGQRENSIAAYRKAIGCNPSFGSAWWALANMKTVRFSDADIFLMQEQLKRPDASPDDRMQMQIALGKAYEDQRVYQRSFEHYAKANAAMRLRHEYDADRATSRVAAYKALFTPDFVKSHSETGCKAPDPIFVLGQPRSGSTLIEQILSSHSAIEGTAELPYIPTLVLRLEERECRELRVDYPGVLAKLDPALLTAFGEDYIRDTSVHRKLGRPFFIDKKPANFHHVGLIHLILPNAKIIDARRHPAACSLSIFKQYYSGTRPRLGELGRAYRDYVELLAHFDRAMPGRVHRVIYEELVADPEAELRRLLAYLGLPFEEKCLRFYETERAILTPSSEQVRRPITGEAVDYWRNYQPWLGPLLESLGSVLTAYPSVPEELR
ncbi:MAG: sulfotransferase [Rhizomicrobium sp.]|jgi:tetratricopeptide (TPR) repeat protein